MSWRPLETLPGGEEVHHEGSGYHLQFLFTKQSLSGSYPLLAILIRSDLPANVASNSCHPTLSSAVFLSLPFLSVFLISKLPRFVGFVSFYEVGMLIKSHKLTSLCNLNLPYAIESHLVKHWQSGSTLYPQKWVHIKKIVGILYRLWPRRKYFTV